MARYQKLFVPIVAIVVFLIFWEWLVWVNGWPNYKMASPTDIGPAFWKFKELFIVIFLAASATVIGFV